MTIQVGDKLPEAKLKRLTPDGIKDVSIKALTGGKKVVLFAVPGAFTPTCSERHLPGFVEQAEALKAKGIDTIACVAVNDPFVMSAWEKAHAADIAAYYQENKRNYAKGEQVRVRHILVRLQRTATDADKRAMFDRLALHLGTLADQVEQEMLSRKNKAS